MLRTWTADPDTNPDPLIWIVLVPSTTELGLSDVITGVVAVDVAVAVVVEVAVDVLVAVVVAVEVAVVVAVSVAVPVTVAVLVTVPVAVGVLVGVLVLVGVGVPGPTVGVRVGVFVAVPVGVGDPVFVAVTVDDGLGDAVPAGGLTPPTAVFSPRALSAATIWTYPCGVSPRRAAALCGVSLSP